MEIRDMQIILEDVKFLNHVFELRPCGIQGVALSIRYNAPDTRNRALIVPIQCVDTFYPDNIRNPAELISRVHSLVLATVKHEISELFLVNGNDIYNEHKNQTTQQRQEIINEMFNLTLPTI